MTKIDTLIRLLGEARAEAEQLGPGGRVIVGHLDEALTEARSLAAQRGRPDEGKRPEQLSSDNDG